MTRAASARKSFRVDAINKVCVDLRSRVRIENAIYRYTGENIDAGGFNHADKMIMHIWEY